MVSKKCRFYEVLHASSIVIVLLFIACGQGVERIMVDENQENSSEVTPEQEDMKLMEEFIFKPDRFSKGVVPRNFQSKDVAQFLIEKIDENAELKVLAQVEKAASFYDTYEVAEKFSGFLGKTESGETGIRRSIILARTIARVGKPEDLEPVKKYYSALLGKLDKQIEFEEFISLHETLGFGLDSKALREKIDKKISALSGATEDYASEVQVLKFKGKILQELKRAEKVEDSKQKILSISDRRKRIEEEIKAYLALDYGYLEYLEPWSAKRIRQETWAAQPSEQHVRNDEAPLKAEVSKAFREFLAGSDFESAPDDEKEFLKLKIFRAVKFFGGEISEDEEDFLQDYKGEQADTLANEGFQLPKEMPSEYDH